MGSIESKAAEQCAPVIFGVKPSNLLMIHPKIAREMKPLIECTGLKARCLSYSEDRQIWFLYNEAALESILSDEDNRRFISQFGYSGDLGLKEILIIMNKRFKQFKNKEIPFPHELGVMLGYPLCDVKGFIENQGRDCLYTGYWKVYENEQAALRTFQLYNYVKKIALKWVDEGIGFQAESVLAYQKHFKEKLLYQ